jgi:SAM-dependent methyltransferase
MSLRLVIPLLIVMLIVIKRWNFTDLQVRLLRLISPAGPNFSAGDTFYAGKSKVGVLMGDGFFEKIRGKTVIDFGCGEGAAAVEMAREGAARVIGVDIRPEVLKIAEQSAREAGVCDRCTFVTSSPELADFVVSVDAFEHFADPGDILRRMSQLLRPSGEVLVSFGPTWYHPLGGHLFSIFPWSHLIFTEEALMRWRSAFDADGAKRFGEVGGGLNQMTISRFEKLVAESPLKMAAFHSVPIRRLRPLHNRLTREFTTAVVQCRLVKPGSTLG